MKNEIHVKVHDKLEKIPMTHPELEFWKEIYASAIRRIPGAQACVAADMAIVRLRDRVE